MGNPLLGNSTVVQIGLLVNDVEKTAGKYAEFFGIEKPEIIITDGYDLAKTEYNDKPSETRAKLAFFKVGEKLEIELIEPDKNPSTWRDVLDENGDGFHHIAFIVNGMKEKVMQLEQNGMKLLQKGEYKGGRYAYVDALSDLKLVLELLEND
jgi:hypothetical protein